MYVILLLYFCPSHVLIYEWQKTLHYVTLHHLPLHSCLHVLSQESLIIYSSPLLHGLLLLKKQLRSKLPKVLWLCLLGWKIWLTLGSSAIVILMNDVAMPFQEMLRLIVLDISIDIFVNISTDLSIDMSTDIFMYTFP